MKFKAVASPEPKRFKRDWSKIEKLTVPDQSLSLQEVLERFSRKEALPIGHQGSYNDEIEVDSEFAVDLEKLEKADMLDKMIYAEQWSEITERYRREDEARNKAKVKAAALKRQQDDEARIQAEVEKRVAKQSTATPAV